MTFQLLSDNIIRIIKIKLVCKNLKIKFLILYPKTQILLPKILKCHKQFWKTTEKQNCCQKLQNKFSCSRSCNACVIIYEHRTVTIRGGGECKGASKSQPSLLYFSSVSDIDAIIIIMDVTRVCNVRWPFDERLNTRSRWRCVLRV